MKFLRMKEEIGAKGTVKRRWGVVCRINLNRLLFRSPHPFSSLSRHPGHTHAPLRSPPTPYAPNYRLYFSRSAANLFCVANRTRFSIQLSSSSPRLSLAAALPSKAKGTPACSTKLSSRLQETTAYTPPC